MALLLREAQLEVAVIVIKTSQFFFADFRQWIGIQVYNSSCFLEAVATSRAIWTNSNRFPGATIHSAPTERYSRPTARAKSTQCEPNRNIISYYYIWVPLSLLKLTCHIANLLSHQDPLNSA